MSSVCSASTTRALQTCNNLFKQRPTQYEGQSRHLSGLQNAGTQYASSPFVFKNQFVRVSHFSNVRYWLYLAVFLYIAMHEVFSCFLFVCSYIHVAYILSFVLYSSLEALILTVQGGETIKRLINCLNTERWGWLVSSLKNGYEGYFFLIVYHKHTSLQLDIIEINFQQSYKCMVAVCFKVWVTVIQMYGGCLFQGIDYCHTNV